MVMGFSILCCLSVVFELYDPEEYVEVACALFDPKGGHAPMEPDYHAFSRSISHVSCKSQVISRN